MIEFVPLEYYTTVFYHSILFLVLINLVHSLVLEGNEMLVINYSKVLSIAILLLLIFYMGLRPVSGRYFVDMSTYSEAFRRVKAGYPIRTDGDLGFGYFLKFCTTFLSETGFFLFCAILYLSPLYIAAKRWFPKYHYFAFLMFLASFSFWAYGVNGIRNGLATSFLILAFSYADKKVIMGLLMLLSVLFHKSMMLPVLAFFSTYFIKNIKIYYIIWFASIGLSITMGSFWENIFIGLGFGDDRLSGYLSGEADESKFSSTGFRYDFLIYSAMPVFAGYYFVIKRKFNDPFYIQLLQTYLLANAFWIMVIRANFSNRFAYLSWFMMAIVICYPLLKHFFWEKQFAKLGYIICFYFAFTYVMHLLILLNS